MLTRLVYLAAGQVRVRVQGASLPRFLNACTRANLTLRRLERTAWNELYVTLSIKDFRTLRHYMGRTGCRVHVVQRRGFPFFITRLRPRVALWSGGLALIWLLWLLGTHIWAIDLQIDPILPHQEVVRDLSALGVNIGAQQGALDLKKIRLQMLTQYPEMTFFALNLQGNRMRVVARGAPLTEPKLDEQAQTAVVATRAGVVHSLRVQQGQPLVAPGSAVQQGDVLIASVVPPTAEGGSYHATHARGQIQAYTTYQTTIGRAATEQRKQYTEQVKRQYALVIANKRLNLYFGCGISRDTCDKIVETKELWLSDSVVLPIRLVVQTYRSFTTTEVVRTPEEVKVHMLSRALGTYAAQMEGTVLTHREHLASTEQGDAIVLTLSVDALEQIGTEVVDDTPIPAQPPSTVTALPDGPIEQS